MNGVTFGIKHSYNDWGLLLKSRPVIGPPVPKTVYVDIPGSDGILDLTESLTGDVAYNTRPITCEFLVVDARRRWYNIYSEIMDYLHGQQLKVIMDEDPNYYYKGRLQVSEWNSDKLSATIVIKGDIEPYKMEMFSSLEDWEWDSFNFETGVIREYSELRVDGALDFTVIGSRKKVIPRFIVHSDDGSGLQVAYNGNTYSIPDGTTQVVNIAINSGTSVLTFTGNGTVSIDYRGGRL